MPPEQENPSPSLQAEGVKPVTFWKRKVVLLPLALIIIVGGTYLLAQQDFFSQALSQRSHPFPLVAPDEIESWTGFTDPTTGKEVSLKNPNAQSDDATILAEIEQLKSLLKTEESDRTVPARISIAGTYGLGVSDYDIYIAIASYYEYLGQGDLAYEYLGKAISTDPNRSLAYKRLGTLMMRLFALNTARAAYLRAVTIDPSIENHLVYGQFLEGVRQAKPDFPHLLQDIKDQEKRIEAALLTYPDNVDLLRHKAYWLGFLYLSEPTSDVASQQKEAAIETWERLRELGAISAEEANRMITGLNTSTARMQEAKTQLQSDQAGFDILAKGTPLAGHKLAPGGYELIQGIDRKPPFDLRFDSDRSYFTLYRGTDLPEKGIFNTTLLVRNGDGKIFIFINSDYIQFADQRVSLPGFETIPED